MSPNLMDAFIFLLNEEYCLLIKQDMNLYKERIVMSMVVIEDLLKDEKKMLRLIEYFL